MGKAKRFLGNQLPRNDRLNKALGRQSNTLRSQNITPTNQLPGIPNNDFLKSSGSLHSGADGFISQDLTIDTGILDLQANAVGDIVKVRKYININPESGTTDTLDLVASGGTEFPQQELVLVGQSGDVLTITHDSGSAAGNNRAILCPGAVAYTLNGTDAVALFYDFTLSKWRIEGDATSGGGGGAGFPLSYTVHDEGTHSGNLDHDLSLASGHKLQFTATADVDIDILNIPSGTAMDFYIEVTQDSTGGWTITANDAEWVNFPTLSTTADTVSLIACHADGDGNIRAITLLNASPTSGNFADKQLSNLTGTTSIPVDLLPSGDGTIDIGNSTSLRYAGVHAATFKFDTNRRLDFNIGGGSITVNGSLDSFTLTVDSVQKLSSTATLTTLTGNVDIVGVTGVNDKIEFDEITDPGANPDPNTGWMYGKLVSGHTEPFWEDEAGTITNMLAGSQTPWVSNIDADGFDLQDFGDISFTNGHTLTSTGVKMLIDLSASTDDFQLEFGDSTKITTFSNNQLDFSSNTASWGLQTLYAPTTPADGNVFALYDHNFKNSIGTLETWAKIECIATDVTDGTEDATIAFSVMDGGTLKSMFEIIDDVVTVTSNAFRFETNVDIEMNSQDIHDIGALNKATPPSITGSRGGNAALASLLSAFDGELWTDNTT